MSSTQPSDLCPAPVRAALDRAVELGEVGLQVAAYLDGKLIVDAWTGQADPEAGRPVGPDTLFPIFSVTKALATVSVHVQAERGLVEYDAPLARYWPEFAAHGKDGVRVADVLTHRSGVPHIPQGTGVAEMADWDHMAQGIADLAPLYPPGERSTYQARSMGWMLGEVVRRTDPEGRPFGRFLREEILDPLGCADTWVGLPDEQEGRLAALVGAYAGPTPDTLAPGRGKAYGSLTAPDIYASRTLRRACLPASGAITTARSEARFWAMLANGGELDGVRLLSPERVRAFPARRDNPEEFDEVLGLVPLIGRGGFWIGGPYPLAEAGIGDRPSVICQPGAGGSLGWADVESGLAVAICHNRMFTNHPVRDEDEHPMTAIGNAVRAVADAARGAA
ncbi:MAG TPA: serine hydrolase domain-containing protein [Baekduia sp.]|uniref:serine hydrolase domain-containing protein n=1 Tax=Baekduia sp. TaxID=2600305 RepID=UPI002D7869B0|nr:serine hydrolase domain-containing protein [Baekduia sp.]HET6509954.1 serine hydrolase domain-containing protein [Baekduia sp.]